MPHVLDFTDWMFKVRHNYEKTIDIMVIEACKVYSTEELLRDAERSLAEAQLEAYHAVPNLVDPLADLGIEKQVFFLALVAAIKVNLRIPDFAGALAIRWFSVDDKDSSLRSSQD